MSGVHLSLFLFRAIRLLPAKNRDTELGAFPAASILMTDLRDEHMGVGRGMLATSSRCWTRKPEGPAAVLLGNDCRTERMLKSGCMQCNSFRGLENRNYWSRAAGVFCFQKLPCVLIVWSNTT